MDDDVNAGAQGTRRTVKRRGALCAVMKISLGLKLKTLVWGDELGQKQAWPPVHLTAAKTPLVGLGGPVNILDAGSLCRPQSSPERLSTPVSPVLNGQLNRDDPCTNERSSQL